MYSKMVYEIFAGSGFAYFEFDISYLSYPSCWEPMVFSVRESFSHFLYARYFIRQDKLAYSKEWFPTSAETDQINSEVNEFNCALNALHSASANYNLACAGGQ